MYAPLKLMVLVDPKLYKEYVQYSPKGQAMIYFHMIKVLDGRLKSAIWFYKKLCADLET